MQRSRRIALSGAVILLLCVVASAQQARISFVQGTVKVGDSEQGLFPATVGTPIHSFTLISTGDDGLAEIEFQDGSMLRLTGDTEVQFEVLWKRTALITKDRGTSFALAKGTIYFWRRRDKHEFFSFHANHLWWAIAPPVDCRVSREADRVLVTVFDGSMSGGMVFNGIDVGRWPVVPFQNLMLHAGESLLANAKTALVTDIAKGVEHFRTDEWNASRNRFWGGGTPWAVPVKQGPVTSSFNNTVLKLPVISSSLTEHSKSTSGDEPDWHPVCEQADGVARQYEYDEPLAGLPKKFIVWCVPCDGSQPKGRGRSVLINMGKRMVWSGGGLFYLEPPLPEEPRYDPRLAYCR